MAGTPALSSSIAASNDAEEACTCNSAIAAPVGEARRTGLAVGRGASTSCGWQGEGAMREGVSYLGLQGERMLPSDPQWRFHVVF